MVLKFGLGQRNLQPYGLTPALIFLLLQRDAINERRIDILKQTRLDSSVPLHSLIKALEQNTRIVSFIEAKLGESLH